MRSSQNELGGKKGKKNFAVLAYKNFSPYENRQEKENWLIWSEKTQLLKFIRVPSKTKECFLITICMNTIFIEHERPYTFEEFLESKKTLPAPWQ